VIYVYKDFDTYNGLIETFLILSKKQAELPFDYEVCVFKNRKSDYASIFKNNGGRLINLNFRWGSNPLILLHLYRVFKSRKPDVVQTFILKPNIYGIIAAALAGVPVIIATDLTLTNQAPTRLRRLRDKFLYRIYRQITRWADHVVCISETVKNQLKEIGLFCHMSVIYPPVDLEKMDLGNKENKIESMSKNDKEVVIGNVARLSEEKRHKDLLEAFSILINKYPNLRLLIVGDGPLLSKLEILKKRLKIDERTQFTGFQKEILRYLKGMDIFVLCPRTEGLGIAILEAMACGLPIVATRVGGIPEIVDDQVNGILIDCKRVDQLVSALSDLIEDKDKRKEYGRRGREKVLHLFSFDRYVKEHYSLYVLLLEKKQRIKSDRLQ